VDPLILQNELMEFSQKISPEEVSVSTAKQTNKERTDSWNANEKKILTNEVVRIQKECLEAGSDLVKCHKIKLQKCKEFAKENKNFVFPKFDKTELAKQQGKVSQDYGLYRDDTNILNNTKSSIEFVKIEHTTEIYTDIANNNARIGNIDALTKFCRRDIQLKLLELALFEEEKNRLLKKNAAQEQALKKVEEITQLKQAAVTEHFTKLEKFNQDTIVREKALTMLDSLLDNLNNKMNGVMESRQNEYFDSMNKSLMDGANDFSGVWLNFAKCEQKRKEMITKLEEKTYHLENDALLAFGDAADKLEADITEIRRVTDLHKAEKKNLIATMDDLNQFWLFDINELYRVVQKKVDGPNIMGLEDSMMKPIVIQSDPQIILRHPLADFKMFQLSETDRLDRIREEEERVKRERAAAERQAKEQFLAQLKDAGQIKLINQ